MDGNSNVAPMEPLDPAIVSKWTDEFRKRLGLLEGRMTTVEIQCLNAADCAKIAADNSAELLAVWKATKGTAAFLKKHGPRIIAFGTGLAAAGGFGNLKILHFLQTFFAV